jgi:hypothetical protein
VWVIVLENEDYAHTFGSPSAAPYLARTLPARGADKAGTHTAVKYNHYSSLATVEKLFGLPLLGEARSVTRTSERTVSPSAVRGR